MTPPDSVDVSDLIPRSYQACGGCYGLARLVLARMGLDLPQEQGAALEGREELGTRLADGEMVRAGDVVCMVGTNVEPMHLGVALDAWRVIHVCCGGTVRIDRLEVLERAKAVIEVVRLRRAGAVSKQTQQQVRAPRATMSLITYTNILTRDGRRVMALPIEQGQTVLDVVNGLDVAHGARHLACINGISLTPDEMRERVIKDGDCLIAAPRMGETATIVMALIAVASAAASYLLAASIRLPGPKDGSSGDEQRFGFGNLSNEAFAGDVIPVVLGSHPRWGGKVIAVVPGDNADGRGDNSVKILLCMGHGPFARLGTLAADTDRVDGASLGGFFLNDQPMANFVGCKVSVRMGTTGQRVIPGFDDIETYREVGVGGVVLRNSSGADYTSGSASAEAYTFATMNSVNGVVIRVRFVGGLYTTGTSGTIEARTAKWRYRVRTSDVGNGAGAWSGFTLVTVSQAQRAEVISAPRFGGAGAWNAGVAARMDVQCERVTKEPVTALTQDEMRFDSVVEVTDAQETYAGYCMVALEVKASEQLTGVPKVSVDVDGFAGLRRWDGVSSPSAPVFTEGFSTSPADLVLAVLTNTRWGMGAVFGDSNVNFASLLAWRTASEASVARPGGGTRKKFACHMILSEARDGVDWVRAICRTGRCSPNVVGNMWQFAYDGVQSAAVECFTDGSIMADEAGAPVFEYQREVTTGGRAAPNQWVMQLSNANERGLPDAIVYPDDNALWLDPLGANEPAHTTGITLDGVTDPDQAYSEMVYVAKKTRGITRSITFSTVRDVVAVQPGDRFDVAIETVGWGLASGRLESGCTASTLYLDRSVTLAAATTYYVAVLHLDGTTEHVAIASAAGTYAAGAAITLVTALAQIPGCGVGPTGAGEYAIGLSGAALKPFICTRVKMGDPQKRVWEIAGIEYAADVYDDTAAAVTLPTYSSLVDLTTAPGPVASLTGREYTPPPPADVRRVELAWTQSPADVSLTGSFRVYRKLMGTSTWIGLPESIITSRAATLELADEDRAYEFIVIAVSLGGAMLSPDDPRHPRFSLVIGYSGPLLAAPGGLTLTATSGNTYTLAWSAVTDAVEYQVLFGGNANAMPNAGAEDCLVLARTVETSITGLELPPGQSCTFYVRAVGSNQRMSATAGSVTQASPATPPGETIRATQGTHAFDLSMVGTRTNVTWNATDGRLEQVNAGSAGVWLSPEVDFTTAAMTELTFRPQTDNAAQDISISSAPLTAPSVAADQWGTVDAQRTLGMVFPPWPDNEVGWVFAINIFDGAAWGGWQTWLPCASVLRTCRKYQVRVTLRRNRAPYRAGLRGLTVVGTS